MINLHEAAVGMIQLAEKTSKDLDEALYCLRGPVPESPTSGLAGPVQGGVFAPLERLAGLLVSLQGRAEELKAKIGSEKTASINQMPQQGYQGISGCPPRNY